MNQRAGVGRELNRLSDFVSASVVILVCAALVFCVCSTRGLTVLSDSRASRATFEVVWAHSRQLMEPWRTLLPSLRSDAELSAARSAHSQSLDRRTSIGSD
jgi:hypothetical protein